ncbi:MAG: PTS sugar transporter subunit IIA [Rhodothermales bacterium]
MVETTNTRHIHQLLSPRTVRVGLPGTSKREVIDGLIDLLAHRLEPSKLEQVREAVHEREQRMSTGVGKGLALPHAKTSAVDETIAAFAVTEHPVDFEAIDGRPVRLVFLLVGMGQSGSQHIKLLSRISRLMNREELRERLLKAENAQAVLQAFRDAEAQLLDF